jgi:hypothetical protein
MGQTCTMSSRNHLIYQLFEIGLVALAAAIVTCTPSFQGYRSAEADICPHSTWRSARVLGSHHPALQARYRRDAPMHKVGAQSTRYHENGWSILFFFLLLAERCGNHA